MPGMIDIKRRIKSVSSTRKITRAMQMVSAAKMRKAQNAVVASRSYSTLAWDLIMNLSQKGVDKHSLMRSYPDAKKVGVLLLSTNGGLVGSLNANLLPKLKEIENSEVLADIVTYGKQARVISARLKKDIVADFPKNDRHVNTEDVLPIAQFLTESYRTGQYSKIVILYNYFVSTLVQQPRIKQLLPLAEKAKIALPEEDSEEQDTSDELDSDYIFEPGPSAVLEYLIPRIIESQIYQTILESNASEHSARMVMMKNATEAASELIADLTLTFNQIRQNKITTELAEITAGKIALE